MQGRGYCPTVLTDTHKIIFKYPLARPDVFKDYRDSNITNMYSNIIY